MPIPYLSSSNKSNSGWRNNKKYYISRGASSYNKSSYSHSNGNNGFWSKIPFKKLARFGIIGFIFACFIAVGTGIWISRSLPNPNQLIDREIAQSTKIYDRTGETILYEIHGDEQRTMVELKDIPEYAKWATISIEDKDFYNHKGFSLLAILRTVVNNILFNKKAGGSTLTQQFIKNAVLTTEKTYTRKVKELILAYRVEQKFSKDEILQMYFNEIPYGSTAYGIEAASQKYFGKSVRDINLAEATVLAALPQSPSRYSPYGTNKDILLGRQHYILDKMVEYGHITESEAEEAKNFELVFREQNKNITAPHFVMYIKEILSDKYGEKMVEQGGLKIYTSLDLYKQKIAEEVINEQAEKNKENYEAGNAALVSIDPKNGQILAMVGSRDFFNDEIDGQVNITLSKRQPGSSIKPFVYATAFEKGYTPDTILYDVVTNFSTNTADPYEPHNYSLNENGPVTIRKALAGSLNIPAVKALYLAGVQNVLNYAENAGYSTFADRDRFGLSLVLGGGEVKMIEHVNAFSVFARDGSIQPTTAILKIESANGEVLEEYKETKPKQVFTSQVARQINDILSDNSARAYVFGENNHLTLGKRPVAAKSGTTNDYHDAWTIGYTPSLVTGVWVGNSDNTKMKRGADGGIVAAPIWNKYMQKVLGDTPYEEFKKPEVVKTGKPVLDGNTNGTFTIKIDKASGLLATEYTPEDMIEEKIFRQDHSILYYVNKDDPRGEVPENPSNDPQFELWENAVKKWAGTIETNKDEDNILPPTEYDNVHKPENQPVFSILSPADNETISSSVLNVDLEITAPRGVAKVEYYIDNYLIAVNERFPFSLRNDISFLNNGFHNLKIIVADDVNNTSEKTLEFNYAGLFNQTDNDFSISWLSPQSGLVVSKIDFPITIKTYVTNQRKIAEIKFYAVSSEGSKVMIAKNSLINTSAPSANWTKELPAGTYEIFAEATGWNNKTETTESITITVNND